MGPEDKKTYTLYLGDTPTAPITPGEIPEITLSAEAPEPEKSDVAAACEIYNAYRNIEALALREQETVCQTDDVRGDKPQQCGKAGRIHTDADAIQGSVGKIHTARSMEGFDPMTIGTGLLQARAETVEGGGSGGAFRRYYKAQRVRTARC